MTELDLYREMVNLYGKVTVWSWNTDELLDKTESLVKRLIREEKQEVYLECWKMYVESSEKHNDISIFEDWLFGKIEKELKKKLMEMSEK